MVRKFLYAVAFFVVILVAGAFALRIWGGDLARTALVPGGAFEQQEPLTGNAYADTTMWLSHPRFTAETDPSRGRPDGAGEPTAGTPRFAVFFVHPTSYLERAHWNAPLDDAQSRSLARTYLRGMASAFGAGEVWAPRYRQATFGAFLTDDPDADRAIDAAYRDVALAFDAFLGSIGEDTPIVLAGHSQGARHILELLHDRVAGTPLQGRIAAVYAIGWPISVERDLPALGLPGCATPDQGGCIMSWSSFAEPAEPGDWLDHYRDSPGFDGQPRGDSKILCSNPVTGTIDASAPASANLGTLLPNDELTSGELISGSVPARCDARGILLIGDPPELGPYVLPGNNYHVYDIPLFWRNVEQDVAQKGNRMDGEPLITEQAGEFRAALPDGGVLLGLDLGTQTIGTAFCDAGWSFASAGKTLPRGKFARDKAAIEALVVVRRVKGVVIGLPLNMDGTGGPRAQSSRAYARNLAALGLPVLLWDERWSTASAERAMIDQDMSRARRAERIDSHAAAVILQAAIDRLAGGVL